MARDETRRSPLAAPLTNALVQDWQRGLLPSLISVLTHHFYLHKLARGLLYMQLPRVTPQVWSHYPVQLRNICSLYVVYGALRERASPVITLFTRGIRLSPVRVTLDELNARRYIQSREIIVTVPMTDRW
jgi:hypothetical protein